MAQDDGAIRVGREVLFTVGVLDLYEAEAPFERLEHRKMPGGSVWRSAAEAKACMDSIYVHDPATGVDMPMPGVVFALEAAAATWDAAGVGTLTEPARLICRVVPTDKRLPLILIVTGARDLSAEEALRARAALEEALTWPVVAVIHGGARGVDALAGEIAAQVSARRAPGEAVQVEAVPVRQGESPPDRNGRLFEVALKHWRRHVLRGVHARILTLALPTAASRGTWDTFNKAKARHGADPVRFCEPEVRRLSGVREEVEALEGRGGTARMKQGAEAAQDGQEEGVASCAQGNLF